MRGLPVRALWPMSDLKTPFEKRPFYEIGAVLKRQKMRTNKNNSFKTWWMAGCRAPRGKF